ncbi:MAG: hypothetical protein JXA99_05420 [Candidatus Lokiarchaeota archaeon]|nr:hypothetical protein [Candidatus Lokiarchaeota archaeon]
MSNEKKVDEVYLRNYPKVIFFWPVFFTSFILWIIQWVIGDIPNNILGYFWAAMFFINIFVVAFDFSSTKFFILVLVIVIALVIIIIWLLPNIEIHPGVEFNLGLTWQFYLTMTLMLGLPLGMVVLNAYFSYYKVERNEIYHKSGIFSSAERFPVSNLRIKKSIPDVFEFLFLRAGSMVLIPGRSEDVINLPTVLNINKKAKRIDDLLSHVSVEPDEVD